MTEQQIVPIFGLEKSLQQEEEALTQGLKQLHQSIHFGYEDQRLPFIFPGEKNQ
jgi:hypothetical protein